MEEGEVEEGEEQEEEEFEDEDIDEIIHQLGIYDNEMMTANGNLLFVLEYEQGEPMELDETEEEQTNDDKEYAEVFIRDDAEEPAHKRCRIA